MTERIILTAQCPDRPGLVAAISNWIMQNGGNILQLDQHVDPVSQQFFIRVQWALETFNIPRDQIVVRCLRDLATDLDLDYRISYSDERPRMAIFVTHLAHCLWDILARCESGELAVDVPVIISNHESLRPVAERFGIPYVCLPVTPDNKSAQEARQLEILREHAVDFVVLARYMQVLSDNMVQQYPNRIINIHHSFLPAFAGAKPYHRAYERGVKLIGATAHYVTGELDEGPIIEQDTSHVSHRDTVDDLTRLGRDLEKIVLSRALFRHVHHQVLVHGRRTVVFD